MEVIMNQMISSILLIIVGFVVGFVVVLVINALKEANTDKKIEKMLQNAKKEAETYKRDSILEVKEESHRLKLETEKEIREKKNELKEQEERLLQRESSMDKRDELYQKRETALDEREQKLVERGKQIQEEQDKVDEIKKQQLDILENISGYSREKAKEQIMSNVKDAMEREIALYMSEQEEEARMTAANKAREMIVSSMQRYAADIANDQTVTVVNLPSEDMKGRIIGREGRNIRTLEAITGVD